MSKSTSEQASNQTSKQTSNQTSSQTCNQTSNQTSKQTSEQTSKQTNEKTIKQTSNRHENRWENWRATRRANKRATDMKIDEWTDEQTDEQTDERTDGPKTELEREGRFESLQKPPSARDSIGFPFGTKKITHDNQFLVITIKKGKKRKRKGKRKARERKGKKGIKRFHFIECLETGKSSFLFSRLQRAWKMPAGLLFSLFCSFVLLFSLLVIFFPGWKFFLICFPIGHLLHNRRHVGFSGLIPLVPRFSRDKVAVCNSKSYLL